MWLQMASGPSDILGAAILAMCAEIGFLLLAGLFVALIALWPTESILHVNFGSDLPDWWFRWLPNIVSNLVVPFELGRRMLPRRPGREAAGTITMASLHAAINLCAGLTCRMVAHAGGEMHADVNFIVRIIDWNSNLVHTLTWAAFYLTLYPMLLLAGAAYAREIGR